jgi:hypothetical protein
MSALNYGQWCEKYEHSIKAGFNCYSECWNAAIKFAEENFSSHNSAITPPPPCKICGKPREWITYARCSCPGVSRAAQ